MTLVPSSAVDNYEGQTDKRSWHDNTVRVWGKRPSAADRRSWAGNTIRVWGKRLDVGLTPDRVLDTAATRFSAAPKRSIGGGEASRTPTRWSAEPEVGVGDELASATRSKRSPGYHHGSRWVVRRAAGHRPRWLGPKRSWRTNVIRVWGKRAS